MLDLKRQYESIKDDVAAAVERVLTTQYFMFRRQVIEQIRARAAAQTA